MDVELQQRAVEYGGLESMPDVANRNVTAMPPWEKRKSLLLRRFAQREVSAPDYLPAVLYLLFFKRLLEAAERDERASSMPLVHVTIGTRNPEEDDSLI